MGEVASQIDNNTATVQRAYARHILENASHHTATMF